jgi:hypothetical protein
MAVGGVFMCIASVLIATGWTLAGCLVAAGRFLAQRRRRTFCLVVAGFTAALCMPLGTVQGDLTIIVHSRPSVKQAFEPRR